MNAIFDKRWNRVRRTLAVVCMVLVSVVSIAQVAHNHANDASAARHCSVCVTAHSSLAATSTVVATPVISGHVTLAAERESVASLLLTENAYIRPPPVA